MFSIHTYLSLSSRTTLPFIPQITYVALHLQQNLRTRLHIPRNLKSSQPLNPGQTPPPSPYVMDWTPASRFPPPPGAPHMICRRISRTRSGSFLGPCKPAGKLRGTVCMYVCKYVKPYLFYSPAGHTVNITYLLTYLP